MRIQFVTLFLAGGMFLASGCTSILEVKPQSAITEEVYFTSEGDFEPYVTGIYTQFRSQVNNVTYGMERGEELIAASNARFSVAWSHTLSPSSGAINYNSWYVAIGHCNLLLDKIANFSFASNPDTKRRILAETHALRAYFYFYLLRIIGDTPLMLQAVVDENVPFLPRSSAKEVMDQIIKDLDEAISQYKGMSSFRPDTYPSKYRFSYGAVQALKAEAKLWSAKVLGGGQSDFNDVVSAVSEVELSGVTLNADFGNVVGLRASSNPEVILAAYYRRDETGNNYVVNALPFLSIVQGALNIDELPWASTSANGQGAYQISEESRALFVAHPDDKRITHTWVIEQQPTGPGLAWITKYPGTRYSDDRVPDNDLIVFRLADVYLMKAEAYAGMGNLTEAVAYLNKVRTRAGISEYAGTMEKTPIEREILDERGRELYFENKRWYDLVRFHKGGTIDVYQYVPNLRGKATPLFWPLNTSVLGNNENIVQTEGY